MVSPIFTLFNSIYPQMSFDKGSKETKTAKRSIVSPNLSTELTKLKNLINFQIQLLVLLCQSLGGKPSQTEPQPQTYKLIKRCQQVSKINGAESSCDKTQTKSCILLYIIYDNILLYILGRNEIEWNGKVTATYKQNKIPQKN